jgi:hypothetical protein
MHSKRPLVVPSGKEPREEPVAVALIQKELEFRDESRRTGLMLAVQTHVEFQTNFTT